MSTIQFKEITQGELVSYSAALRRRTSGVTPISWSRARAWATNPSGQADDVVLIVAEVDNRCVGFLGLLYSKINTSAGKRRVAWTSTYYVEPDFRKRAVGAALVLRAKRLGVPVASTNVSEMAQALLKACGFQQLPSLEYYGAELVQSRLAKTLLRRLSTLGLERTWAGRVAQKVVAPEVSEEFSRALNGLERERAFWIRSLGEQEIIDEWLELSSPSFTRGASVLNWMLGASWVSTDSELLSRRYVFSDYRGDFGYRVFCGGLDDTPIGRVVVRFDSRGARRRVAVLDHEFDEDESAGVLLLAAALQVSLTHYGNEIIVPSFCKGALESVGLSPGTFIRKSRAYLWFDPSGQINTSQLHLRFEDGDAAFA